MGRGNHGHLCATYSTRWQTTLVPKGQDESGPEHERSSHSHENYLIRKDVHKKSHFVIHPSIHPSTKENPLDSTTLQPLRFVRYIVSLEINIPFRKKRITTS